MIHIRYINAQGGPCYSVNDIRDFLSDRGVMFKESLPYVAREYCAKKMMRRGRMHYSALMLLRVKPFDDFADWSIIREIVKSAVSDSALIVMQSELIEAVWCGPVHEIKGRYPDFYACLKEVFLTETEKP